MAFPRFSPLRGEDLPRHVDSGSGQGVLSTEFAALRRRFGRRRPDRVAARQLRRREAVRECLVEGSDMSRTLPPSGPQRPPQEIHSGVATVERASGTRDRPRNHGGRAAMVRCGTPTPLSTVPRGSAWPPRCCGRPCRPSSPVASTARPKYSYTEVLQGGLLDRYQGSNGVRAVSYLPEKLETRTLDAAPASWWMKSERER